MENKIKKIKIISGRIYAFQAGYYEAFYDEFGLPDNPKVIIVQPTYAAGKVNTNFFTTQVSDKKFVIYARNNGGQNVEGDIGLDLMFIY